MKNLPTIALMIFLLSSCSNREPIADASELIKADSSFSDYSAKNGLQKAFIEFAHDSVVLLKPNQLPIEGKQSLIDSYHGRNDSNVILTWKPQKARIAESGDMGFTYGFWTLIASNDTSRGTYLTIWKKNSKGEWKYIADTGNEGIGK